VDDFERTVTRHIGELRRFAISLMNDPVAADDLVQESLAKALTKVRGATDIRNLRAYLFTTLHHTFVDWYRSRGNNVCLDDVLWEPSWNGSQMDRMKLRDLSRALRQLPPEHREIILLVGLSGLSYKETAEVVGVPIGTVMSRLCRGREALRQLTGETHVLPLRRVK
jgi:RNA polymerase sigma-70 factor (ECF subfamily)